MRRRLVLAIAAVAGCAVLLFALPLAVVLERSYRDEELLRLERDTDAATRAIDLGSSAPDQIELPRFSGEVGIYATSGLRIRGAGPRIADAATRSALRTAAPSATVPPGRLVVAVPLRNGERVVGVVRAQRTQAEVSGRTQRAWLALAALGVGVLVLAVLAALALGRRLARPLETLAGAARRIGEGDFAARAEATNIREIDEVVTALNLGSRRIGELVSRERAFSAGASHQLRTPLAALRLELEALTLSFPEREPELAAALAQVDRLEVTIETLLGLARGTPAAERRTDLKLAVRELETRWHGVLAADGRPLHVVVDMEASGGAAAISPAVLAEILDVLLQNARMHGRGAVTVTARRAGDAFALEVSDQGPGFAPESAGESGGGGTGGRSGDGHGIGLPLAHALAHAEGARLQITDPGPSPTVSLLISPVASG